MAQPTVLKPDPADPADPADTADPASDGRRLVVARVSGQTRSRLKLKTKRIAVPADAARTGKLTLTQPLRRQLARKRRVTLRLNVRLTDPLGNVRTFSKRLAPRLLRSDRRR